MNKIKIENGMYNIYNNENKKLCSCSLKNDLKTIVKKFYRENGLLSATEWLEITSNSIYDIDFDLPNYLGDFGLTSDFLDTYGYEGIICEYSEYLTDNYNLETFNFELDYE